MVQLEGDVERQREIEQREGMEERGRRLSEQGSAGFGPGIPEGKLTAREALCQVALDGIVEAGGVAIVERD